MKRLVTLSLLTITVLYGNAQSNGDFRSKQDGNWSSPSTWEVYNSGTLSWDPASSVPGSTSSVWIQDADSLFLSQDASCRDLHLNAEMNVGDSARINTGSYVLSVYGKLRTYIGSKGTIPGTNSTGLNNSRLFLVGTLRLAGDSRTATNTGEWGVPLNFINWTLDVALDSVTDVVTIRTNMRAGNITISKGCLLMDAAAGGALRPDGGIAGTGTLTVKAGGTLIMNGTSMARTATERFASFTLEEGGTLILPAGTTNSNIAATATDLSGTVISRNGKVPGNGSISGSSSIDTYTDLRLESGVTLSKNITVNGRLILADNGQLSLSTFALNYGAAAALEYEGTAARTTSDAECPASGGAPELIINNPAGVSLHASRTFKEVLMLNGKLTGSSFSISYPAGGILTYAGNIDTTSDIEFPAMNGPAILKVQVPSLTLHAGRTLDNALSLDAGKLITSSTATLTLGPAGAVSGAGSDRFIDGPLSLTVASASSTIKTFPVGKGNKYSPVNLTVTQDAATPTVYTAELFNTAAAARTLPASLDSVYPSKHWHLSKGTGAGIQQAGVTLAYTLADGAYDSSVLRIAKDDGGGNWLNLGGTGTANGQGTIASDSNFTSLGDFVLAKADTTPAPTSVPSLPAAKNRLVVYPNPATTGLNLEITGTGGVCILSMTDVTGKEVKRLSFNMTPGQLTTKLDVSDLEPGVYFCNLVDGNTSTAVKILIAR